MNTKKCATRLWSLTFACMCAAGLFWQLITITDIYFQYKVSTAVNIFTPDIIKPLDMTFCVDIKSVIQYERVNRDYNTNYKLVDGRVNINFKNWSIQNFFDYTPSNEIIIKKFYYKRNKDARLILVDRNISNKIDVIKFLIRNKVCYKISIKTDGPLKH